MASGHLGMLCTPNEGRVPLDGVAFAADNGCFSDRYVGDDKWFRWLTDLAPHADRCLFATAPDVVGDAQATLKRSAKWLPRIRELGFPAAFVAQDGLEHLEVPWDTFDVLFIGGTTEWKLNVRVQSHLTGEAQRRGKHVHMGRVNSQRRWAYAQWLGCDTVDGTYLAFGPDVNLPDVIAWRAQMGFNFGGVAS
jgi:hypothetical protein